MFCQVIMKRLSGSVFKVSFYSIAVLVENSHKNPQGTKRFNVFKYIFRNTAAQCLFVRGPLGHDTIRENTMNQPDKF